MSATYSLYRWLARVGPRSASAIGRHSRFAATDWWDTLPEPSSSPIIIVPAHLLTAACVNQVPRTSQFVLQSWSAEVPGCGMERRRLADIPDTAPHSGLAPAGSDHQAGLNATRARARVPTAGFSGSGGRLCRRWSPWPGPVRSRLFAGGDSLERTRL
jgi:hypothetical protein